MLLQETFSRMGRLISMQNCNFTMYLSLFLLTDFLECSNGLVENMQYLNRLKEEYADINIPLAALELVSY